MPSKTGFQPRTAWQPSLQLSTVSSSSSILYFSFSQGVFLRSFKVHFSDSVSMPSNTSFEPFLPGSPLSTSPHSSFSKLYFSDISLSKCISLILQSVFLRLPKLQPETICRVPAASIYFPCSSVSHRSFLFLPLLTLLMLSLPIQLRPVN